jgi:hypothetical protein
MHLLLEVAMEEIGNEQYDTITGFELSIYVFKKNILMSIIFHVDSVERRALWKS